MSDSDKASEEKKKLDIESQIRKSLGDVLVTTSGAWDNSLISQDPFSYSQLGQFSSNLLAEALSKSKMEIDTLSQSIRNQFEEEQKMMIENARSSINEQVKRQIEEQQEVLRESFKTSLAEEINKAASKIEQDRKVLQFNLLKSVSNSTSKLKDEIQKTAFKEYQSKLIEQAKQSLTEQIQESLKRNLTNKLDNYANDNK